MENGMPVGPLVIQALMLLAGFAGVAFAAWLLYRGRDRNPRVSYEPPPMPSTPIEVVLAGAGRRRGMGG